MKKVILLVAAIAITLAVISTQTGANSNLGACIGACNSEQGICIAGCEGDSKCISRCASAHGRCVARCNR